MMYDMDNERKNMNKNKMTVVFTVKDRKAMEEMHKAHLNGTLICGMSPDILSWGDQITTPSEIIDGLLEIDSEFPNKKDLTELIEKAEKHLEEA